MMRLLPILTMLGLAACVYEPNDGEWVRIDLSTGIAQVEVMGYADSPNLWLGVQLMNFRTGSWETITRVQSSSTMAYPYGSFGAGSPPLFVYPRTDQSVWVTVRSPNIQRDADHALSNQDGTYMRLRVVNDATGVPLRGGTEAARNCYINNGWGSTRSYTAIAQECGYTATEVKLWLTP